MSIAPTHQETLEHARALVKAIDAFRFSPNVAETDESRALTDALFSIGQKHLQWYDSQDAEHNGSERFPKETQS